VPLVDPLEQVVQSSGDEDKAGHADQFGRDAEAEERLGGRDIVRGRRCVSPHDQFVRNVTHGEEANY
jgi:hypothetical protein